MNKIIYSRFVMLVVFSACALTIVSCKKLIEVPPPENQEVTADVFSNDQNATDAVRGLYVRLMSTPRTLLNGGTSLFTSLSSDDLYRPLPLASEDAFTQYALTSQNPFCNSLYSQSYIIIYQANLVKEQLSNPKNVSLPVKQQLTGEADFVRALLYFYLVNLYGDVPLVTVSDYRVSEVQPRAPLANVYQQIIADLKEAQNFLSPGYVISKDYPDDRTRPNRATATALLARVYLYQRDWLDAEQQATAVIQDNSYQLEPDLNNVFLSSSKEAVWQLQPVNGNYTQEGILFQPPPVPNAAPTYALTTFLANAFEPDDQRLPKWTGQIKAGNTVYQYPHKYKVGIAPSPKKEYNTVLRLAEQYLIRAEARAWQGNLQDAAADLDSVRHRAGLSPVPVLDRDSLLTMIYHERQVEFFAEWGHRWLDLRRTGLATTLLKNEKPGLTAQAFLYPIPLNELQRNSNLTQNPGY